MERLWEVYWESIRRLLEVYWEVFGKSMVSLWEVYGKSMGSLCEVYGKSVVIQLTNSITVTDRDTDKWTTKACYSQAKRLKNTCKLLPTIGKRKRLKVQLAPLKMIP